MAVGIFGIAVACGAAGVSLAVAFFRRHGGMSHEGANRLGEVEARSRAIVEAAVDGIITIDERGMVESFNRASEAIFGYAAAEVIGHNVAMLMPEPYRHEHDGYLRNYLATGRAQIIGIGREVQGQRKDGTTFPMDLAVGESHHDGRRIFAGIVRDITERKRAEESLRASEERMRVMVDGIQDYAIAMIDPDGRLLSWNAGAERLYGWSAAEAIGSFASRFYPLEAIARGEPERALALARAEGRHEEEGYRLRKDGSRFWAQVTISALTDDSGNLNGFVRIVRDMTRHKFQEDGLRQAKRVAEAAQASAEAATKAAELARNRAMRADAAKTKFLAAASHDLRQPVQAILFFTSVLAQKLRNHPTLPILGNLQTSLEGLNVLLDSLLDVSKLDAGLVLPRQTDFAVAAVIDRLASEFLPPAIDKGVDLRVVPSSISIRSDPTLLSRIVQNLMANAVRYTGRGGRVLVGCRRRGDQVSIQVWDSGIGIPADRTGEIFEEFTQLGNPERDRSHGLGLGLAIVDRLSRLLGHQVEVRSQMGKGSMFSVDVPSAITVPAAAVATRLRRRGGRGRGGLVVLIDDEPSVLKGLALMLQSWGYQVLAAASEAEALEKLVPLHQSPSVILADYRLREGHTGTEAVRHIRDLFHSAIPSIIITGDTAPERLREAEASGLSILHKPVQPPALREILRAAFEQRVQQVLH